MKRKTAALVCAVSLIAMSVATACGGNTAATTALDAAQEMEDTESDPLTIWAWDEAFNVKAARDASEIYLQNHPDAEVEVVAMAQDDIVEKLNTALPSGLYEELPDIVLIEDYKAPRYLTAYPDEFAELSDIVQAEDFADYKTAASQVNGKMYGIPFDSGVAAIFYRTDLIGQAGYSQEDMENLTWEEYIEIGKAVREKTGKYLCTLDPGDIGQIRMMMQSAGTWYTDEEGKVSLAGNQGLKDAVEIYRDLVYSGCTKQVTDWDQFVDAFVSGEVATVPTGCWIAPSIQMAEEQSGKWAIAPFPRMGDNENSVNASSIGGGGWYVLKNAGNEEQAKEFLGETFACNVELMNTLAEDITLVSTLNAAAQVENYSKPNEFFGGQEIFKDFAQWTLMIPSVNYGMNTYEIEDIMAQAVQEIIEGADIDSTLEIYQTQAETALAE